MARSNIETLLVCFLLLLGYTTAQENGGSVIKKVTDPTGNINLAPFIQMRSAYECLQNTSDACPDKYQLKLAGWVNVTSPDTGSYCKSCAKQTAGFVLTCISLVKRDFKFVDGTTVRDINNTITQGCAHGFTGNVQRVSAARMTYASKTITLITSALVAWLLLCSSHM
ncbi:hypothetical protein Taro_044495 [Colocasia esculenta]|uniref:DUF7731 domain-containing protein n=1 Tax=Colocasia esculenta TaxID=4460 RepID=A0A843X0Y2_COLES|nr:hypothetical protein [Colocasia esculenta]